MLRCDAVAALPGEAVSVADSPSDTSMLDETVPPGDAAQLDDDSLDATLPPPSPLVAAAVEQDSMESSDSVVLLNQTISPAARSDTGKSAFSDDLFDSGENSAPVDGATFLDVTAPPVDEGSRETSPEIVVVLERVQPEGQDRGTENRTPEELRRTDVGWVKTSKNSHPNDAKARKKAPLHSRSPLAPTQPPAAPRWLSKTKSSCHSGTLDSWLQPNKPPTSDPHIGP
ncbi:unnamed protein product, partial [Gongylonema pulchrum]|uniref:Uncharacterized protein n=1 Tax=Gongylonema pulchrum TaxID=637853 RepID=A0A183ES70_9BILA